MFNDSMNVDVVEILAALIRRGHQDSYTPFSTLRDRRQHRSLSDRIAPVLARSNARQQQ